MSTNKTFHRLPVVGLFFLSTPSWAADPGTPPAPDSPPSAEPHELEEIVVTDTLVESPAAPPSTGTTLDEEQLETFERDDVHEVLLQVPGVQVRGEDGFGLRPNIGIRGTSPERSTKVTLMEDGVLFGPAPYSAPAAYFFPMVTRMTTINVYKGGSQIRFGPNALGGAIDFETASIQPGWSAFADVAGGQFGYFKAHARGGYGAERTGFLLEAVHTQSDGFKQLDTGGSTGFDKNEVMAKWRYNTDPTADVYQQLDVKLGLSTETSNETYLGLTDEDFRDTPYRRYAASELDQMRWHRGQAAVTHTILPSDAWEIQTTAYHHRFTRDWFKFNGLLGASVDEVLRSPDALRNQIFYDVLTGQANSSSEDEVLVLGDNYRWYISQGIQTRAQAKWRTGPVEHELEFGLRLHQDEVNRLHTEHFFEMTDGSVTAAGLPQRVTTRNQGLSRALALHVLDELRFDEFTFTPGVRLEVVANRFEDRLDASRNNENTQIGVLPGMGVHYQLTKEIGLLGGAYRGFSPVPPQPASPEAAPPEPEESLNFELGARYQNPMLYLEVVGFFNDYANLTALCSESRSCAPDDVGNQFNAGAVNVYGLEAVFAFEKKWNDWTLSQRNTYALTFSEFLTSFDSDNPEWGAVEAGDELAYLPRHQFTWSLGTDYQERVALDLNWTAVSPTREVAGQGDIPDDERTDALMLVGAAARVRVVGPLWLYGKVQNLLDQAYLASRRPLGARPGSPLWVQAGLKATY